MLQCQRDLSKCIIMINSKKVLHELTGESTPGLFVYYWHSGMLINRVKLVLNHKSFVKLFDLPESYSPTCKIRMIISIFSKCNVLNYKINLKVPSEVPDTLQIRSLL